MSTPVEPPVDAVPDLEAVRSIAVAIEAWFAANARDLPWRRERSGYAALVSEAMLQQTQVSRVVDKYRAFLAAFPTAADLAAADERSVLAAWQGLGYYARAKRLHAAAKAIVERHRGEVPGDPEALRALPGIGRYTAGAIASIAFGARVPIVDTNVVRVLMRLGHVQGPASSPATVAWAWRQAERLVARATDPSVFNEGLMEFGATVCPAGRPKCGHCPLATRCAARKDGDPALVPLVVRAKPRRRVHHHVVVVVREGRVLVEQRPDTGLWSSMWQAPTIEADARLDRDAFAEAMSASLGTGILGCAFEREFLHRTSHREVVFVVHRAALDGRRRTIEGREWIDAEELGRRAFANPMLEIVRSAFGVAGRSAVTRGPRAARRTSADP